MYILVFILVVMLAVVFGNKWVFHLLLVTAMYLFYLYQWYDYLFYTGKAGWKGFGLFINTLYSAPVFILYHSAAFFIARNFKEKRVVTISITGLILCAIHICLVCSSL